MGKLTDKERQIATNAIGKRYKMEVGAMTLNLTIKEMNQTVMNIMSFNIKRSRKDNPEKFDSRLHGDIFTEEEKININNSMRG